MGGMGGGRSMQTGFPGYGMCGAGGGCGGMMGQMLPQMGMPAQMQQSPMQQEQPQQQRRSAPTPAASQGGQQSAASGDHPPIVVSGCQANPTVNQIIKGHYLVHGQNHGKPIYKKQDSSPNAVNVLIYYWDERDGPAFSGWWFGPKVGGDQVWAYNDFKASPTPPLDKWRVPWDGPEDPSLQLQFQQPQSQRSPRPSQPQSQPQAQQMTMQQMLQMGATQQQTPARQLAEDPFARAASAASIAQAAAAQAQAAREAAIAAQQQAALLAEQQAAQQQQRAARAEAERQRVEREKQLAQERKLQEDERRKRAQEEQERRTAEREAEQARRAEALKKQREEEEKRRKENAAALAVRKVIQKVRLATPDTYEAIRAELEEAQEKNTEAMGAQALRVAQEAQQTMEQTLKRIQAQLAKREEDVKKREELEKRKVEEAERVERLKSEILDEVKEAEGKVSDVKGLQSDFMKPNMGPAALAEACKAVAQAVTAATEALGTIEGSVRLKWQDMGSSDDAIKVKEEVRDMLKRVTDGKHELEVMARGAMEAKERAFRKAVAWEKEQEQHEFFNKHDTDRDGILSRDEVLAFSREEFGFEPAAVVLDKIMRTLQPVEFDKFRPLFQKIAIARSEVRARAERTERQRRQKLSEAHRKALEKVCEEAGELLHEAEAALGRAEAEAGSLAAAGSSGSGGDSSTVKEHADAAEKLAEGAQAVLDQVSAKFKQASAECDACPELRGKEQSFTEKLTARHAQAQSRADKVLALLGSAREHAARKAYSELSSSRTSCVNKLRLKLAEEAKSAEDLFGELSEKGGLSRDKFVELVRGLKECTITDEQAGALFDCIGGGKAISKERFLEFTRLFYKCVKGTVLSEDLSIKTKTIRRLEVGDVLEAIEGPSKEGTAGVMRVKCKAASDHALGWVTIAGNQGTSFLEPGFAYLCCVKDVSLTAEESLESEVLRKVTKGEVFEVLEFAKKDDSADVRRIRGRSKQDEVVGWLTWMQSTSSCLEPC